MQFIEKSDLSVRSAIYHLKCADTGLEFILFPMIHIGSKEFYEEVSRRLAACDLILAEGVAAKKAMMLTFSYRIVSKIRRMGLVTQQEGLKTTNLRSKILRADIAGHVFDERWAALPLSLRLQLLLFVPVYALYLFLFGTRETIAAYIALEDLPAREEILLQDESFEKLDALLIDERDRSLLQSIETLYRAKRNDKQVVAIVYGAMHMRNVTGFLLHTLKYRVEKAEWVTVFCL